MRIRLPLVFLVFFLAASAVLSSQSGNTNAPATANAQPAAAAAQQPGTTTPTIRANTRLVMVDVVVRDKKGEFVPDLQASDFKLMEDGKEQAISIFSLQQGSSEPFARNASTLPPNVFRNTPKYRPNSALNVILLDGLNSSLLEQAYVRSEMIKFLEKLPEGHPVAIYMLGKKLRLLQDFTTDLGELKRIIHTFKGESPKALASAGSAPETPIAFEGFTAMQAQDMGPWFRNQVDSFAQEHSSDQMDERLNRTMAALNSLARMLSGYQGRKNLIWISDGIPLNIVPSAQLPQRIDPSYNKTNEQPLNPSTIAHDGGPELNRRNYFDQVGLLCNTLADSQIAVYPIDARGLVGDAFANVAHNVSGQGAAGGILSGESAQSDELFEAHSNMLTIAEATGGKAFYNRNDIDNALRNGIDDGSRYYSLGYYPDNKTWNGRFRKIKVVSQRSGMKLRYRTGYFAVDRAAFMKNNQFQRDLDLGQALSFDAPAATAIQFEARVILPSPETRNKLVLEYAVDPNMVTFEKVENGLEHAQVDCVVRAFTRAGGETPVKTQAERVDGRLKPEAFENIKRTFYPCRVETSLGEGHYYLRLVVRDNLSGLVGSSNAEVTIPASGTSQAQNVSK